MRQSLRWARLVALAGLGGLAVLAAAHELSERPAFTVRVRWRADVSALRQKELERRYLLVNGRAPNPSIAYDLLDDSTANIKALVLDPAVVDTNDIDRRAFIVRPGTAAGAATTWVAYRVPALRNIAFLRTFVALLAIIAIVGLVGCAADLRRLLRGVGALVRLIPSPWPVLTRIGHALVADDVGPPGPPAREAFVVKTAIVLMLIAVIGPPLVSSWQALLLACSTLAVICAVTTRRAFRFGLAAAVVMAVLGIKAVLPRADIAEAHNAFLVLHDGEPLEKGLPPEIFRSWRQQFDAAYPPSAEKATLPYRWRDMGTPWALYTQSADAIWRKPRYTRQVDTIDFRTVGQFRGGFANECEYNGSQYVPLYNFWVGQIRRDALPFYVMYQLTPASIGSSLGWQGQVFWEQDGGRFAEIVHDRFASRVIEPRDGGRRVYALFIPDRDAPWFSLTLSPTLRVSRWIEALLTIGGVVAVLALTIRPRWNAYIRLLAVFLGGYYVVARYRGGSGEFLGPNFPPHSGGDDGLLHDGWGRMMALAAGRGDVWEALKGGEPVYWFTPGTRYFRMVEKLIFGDTNLLYAIAVACLPVALFFLIRQLAGARRALAITALFCWIPVGNLSLLQYISYARAGYGEAIGAGMFFLGLALMLRTQPSWGGAERNFAMIWLAGAALAASMIIRPNFALAVVWLGAAYVWASWTRRDFAAIAVVACGLALALWLPFHNVFFGHQFFLVSKSGATISVPLGPRDYAAAAADVLRGQLSTRVVAATAAQLKGWLQGPGFVGSGPESLAWITYVLKLMAQIGALWIGLRWITRRDRDDAALGVIAIASICAQAPMLFIYDTNFRYAVLGWDLALIVAVVWIARRVPMPVAQARFSPA